MRVVAQGLGSAPVVHRLLVGEVPRPPGEGGVVMCRPPVQVCQILVRRYFPPNTNREQTRTSWATWRILKTVLKLWISLKNVVILLTKYLDIIERKNKHTWNHTIKIFHMYWLCLDQLNFQYWNSSVRVISRVRDTSYLIWFAACLSSIRLFRNVNLTNQPNSWSIETTLCVWLLSNFSILYE